MDFQKRIGIFIPQSVGGESYKAYVPRKLPPDPSLNLEKLYPQLDRAPCNFELVYAVFL